MPDSMEGSGYIKGSNFRRFIVVEYARDDFNESKDMYFDAECTSGIKQSLTLALGKIS